MNTLKKTEMNLLPEPLSAEVAGIQGGAQLEPSEAPTASSGVWRRRVSSDGDPCKRMHKV